MIVSVIIPTYKRSLRLPIAIESVLNQTYRPVEIIVVDDNGDNEYRIETKSVLEKYISQNKITYIEHKTNKGGCAARNTGASSAKGEYIAFLDDDDFYEPTKIEEQINFLKNNKNLDACMCSMYRIYENNQQIESRENIARGETLKEAILDGNVFTSMLLIKKEVFFKIGGFSEIPRFQDKYFHYKFLENGYRIGILNKQLLTLVEHSEERISLVASNKVIISLNKLHEFEIKYKTLFDNKEWKFIMNRFYYEKAYDQVKGDFKQKINAIINIFKSLPYFTGQFNYLILFIKVLTPNFILKKRYK